MKTVNSIAFRITAMVIAIALMVLLFTCGALFWHQSWSIRNNLAHDLGVTTDIVSNSAAVATMPGKESSCAPCGVRKKARFKVSVEATGLLWERQLLTVAPSTTLQASIEVELMLNAPRIIW